MILEKVHETGTRVLALLPSYRQVLSFQKGHSVWEDDIDAAKLSTATPLRPGNREWETSKDPK